MKRVLVTEINNPLDLQLVEHLISENYIVRIIAAEINAGSPLLKLPVEIFPANLSKPAELVKAVKGCQYIIQTAPCETNGHNKTGEAIRLLQHLNLTNAAHLAGVKTIVHICSHSTKSNTSDVLQIPFLSQPCNYPSSIQTEKHKLRSAFISLGDIAVDTATTDSANYHLRDVAKAITQVLLKGTHGKTYFIGKADKLQPGAFKTITHAKTELQHIIRKIADGIITIYKQRIGHLGSWASLMVYCQ